MTSRAVWRSYNLLLFVWLGVCVCFCLLRRALSLFINISAFPDQRQKWQQVMFHIPSFSFLFFYSILLPHFIKNRFTALRPPQKQCAIFNSLDVDNLLFDMHNHQSWRMIYWLSMKGQTAVNFNASVNINITLVRMHAVCDLTAVHNSSGPCRWK